MNRFNLGDFRIGDSSLTVISGPCLAESFDLCLEVGTRLQRACQERGFNYVFKASFDKANRSSGSTGRGDGMAAGLEIISRVKHALGVPATTDIHESYQAAPVAETVELLQIPAFLCRQTDLLAAAAATGRAVNVKKGQFLSPHDARNIVDKLQSLSASGIMLTERGTSFGYNTLVVDMPGLEIMRSFGVPVCFDATHSAQRPGGAGASSGGVRESIPAMVRAAMAVGVDALFIEAHPDPTHAMSDRETQWPLDRIEELLDTAARYHAASKK